MNRNFKYLLWLLALLISMAVLSACQTKKKSLDIQKDQSSEKVELQKSEESKVKDKTVTESNTAGEYSEEETITADSLKVNPDGSVVYFKPQKLTKRKGKKSEQNKKQNDLTASHSAKSDSSGKKAAASKSKIAGKEVKESVSAKFYGIGFLIIAVLLALWYIKKQVKPVSKAVDLFI